MKLVIFQAFMLNNRAKKDSQTIIENLKIEKNNIIADIGSGGGYFTFEFAKTVGENGMVYAVDINKNYLEYIKAKKKAYQVKNIATLKGDENGFILPDKKCDLIFMRNVFHHISDKAKYFNNIKVNLNPNGRIAVIDWIPKRKGLSTIYNKHYTLESEICNSMQAAGFKHIESFNFLSSQSFNIFCIA